MTAVLRPPYVVAGTPAGDRWIFEVERASFDGERLRGTATGRANADWMVVGSDGTGSLDVRALMTTDDGAVIFVHYTGRVDVSAGPGAPVHAPLRHRRRALPLAQPGAGGGEGHFRRHHPGLRRL
jgi:hypothetical protein